jgi:hypothetical protein
VKDRLSGRKGRSAYSQRKADPLIFGAKMAPYLWRADLSFRNSVTGSGSRAKCSNILQDKRFGLNLLTPFKKIIYCNKMKSLFLMPKNQTKCVAKDNVHCNQSTS